VRGTHGCRCGGCAVASTSTVEYRGWQKRRVEDAVLQEREKEWMATLYPRRDTHAAPIQRAVLVDRRNTLAVYARPCPLACAVQSKGTTCPLHPPSLQRSRISRSDVPCLQQNAPFCGGCSNCRGKKTSASMLTTLGRPCAAVQNTNNHSRPHLPASRTCCALSQSSQRHLLRRPTCFTPWTRSPSRRQRVCFCTEASPGDCWHAAGLGN
jgi:hypothetical protein